MSALSIQQRQEEVDMVRRGQQVELPMMTLGSGCGGRLEEAASLQVKRPSMQRLGKVVARGETLGDKGMVSGVGETGERPQEPGVLMKEDMERREVELRELQAWTPSCRPLYLQSVILQREVSREAPDLTPSSVKHLWLKKILLREMMMKRKNIREDPREELIVHRCRKLKQELP